MSIHSEGIAGLAALILLSLASAGCKEQIAAWKEREQQIAMRDAPASVKATIEQEAQGGSVREIEKSTEGGKTVYTAKVVANGQEQETLIAEDGQVIRRQAVEQEDDRD